MPVMDADTMQDADFSNVAFATVWNPPAGLLDKCPNLRCVMSLGAGVDTLMAPGLIPQHLPIARIVDPLMASRMATWVVWGVINWQRKMDQYAEAQRRCHWDQSIEARANRDNCDVAVGVMGMGVMGLATARALQSLGYQVSGWSRAQPTEQQQAERAGITTFVGQQQLQAFVSQQDVLVCLLPLTAETTGIINAQLLSWLRPGSALINGGRGKHVVEDDLLAALDQGQVGFALLDVFGTEPLPASSGLWTQPHVRITPHVASMTTLETAADQIAANYHRVVAGDGPLPTNVVDRLRGY